jgi:ketosteroid isomerase-like protein
MRRNILAIGAAVILLGVSIAGFAVRAVATSEAAAKVGKGDLAARVQRLEDREEIRQLMHNYGRTLDKRDFGAFADIWSDDAEYAGGGPTGTVKGPAAIRAVLEKMMAANPSGIRPPNFHLFYNENIEVDGDRATATSKGAFVAPGDTNRAEMVILASYDDIFVRERGQWKIQRRAVHGDIPAPANSGNR